MKRLLRQCCWTVLIFSAASFSFAEGGSPGSVDIRYVLFRIPKIASNQLAVWIEDGEGSYLKTVYAARFTAGGGFRRRPHALPEWVRVSNWENASASEVAAVSGATQKPGEQHLVWDCTDGNGYPVPAGTYVYKIEGNIYWENRVIWQGRIEVGEVKNSSIAQASYFPAGAAEKGVLLEDVRAVFTPHP
jgi:hypothetical protein